MRQKSKKSRMGRKRKINKIKILFSKIIKWLKNIKIAKWQLLCLFLIPIIIFMFEGWMIDNDSWFLLNYGKYILNNGFPTIEPFTIHYIDNFVVQQWLFDIPYYLLYKYTGMLGVFIVLLIIVILTIYMFYKLCMLISKNNYIVSMILSVIAAIIMFKLDFFTTRPQIITYLVMLFLVYSLEKFVLSKNYKWLFTIPLLSIIEINVHASMWWFIFIFSLPFLLELLFEKYIKKNKNVADFRWLIIILCLAFVCAFLNPYGGNAIAYFFEASSSNVDTIYEMRSVDVFSGVGLVIIGIMFLSFITIYLKKNKEIKLRYILLLFGTYMMAMKYNKSVSYYAFFGLLWFAYYYDDLFRYNMGKVNVRLLFKVLYGVSCILVVCGVGYLLRDNFILSNEKFYDGYHLDEAADYLLDNYDVNDVYLYTSYNNGAYMEYRGFKCYMDARAEIFYIKMNKTVDYFNEYLSLQNGEIKIDDFLSDYEFTHLLVTSDDILALYEEIDGYELIDDSNYYRLYVKVSE